MTQSHDAPTPAPTPGTPAPAAAHAPAPRAAGAAPRVHRGPVIPQARIVPNPVMEALAKEVFAPFKAEYAYAVDEVCVVIPRQEIAKACQLAKTDQRLQMDYLRCLVVTEYPAFYQVSYLLYSINKKHKLILKANAPKDDPSVPSVTAVWSGANWHEREGAELFGVAFMGHPDPKHLLLFEEFDGKYPMRKDYPYEDIVEWSPGTHKAWEAQP